jgi:hypothetical protein
LKRDEAIKYLQDKVNKDEQVFPLIGRDKLAPIFIRAYAETMSALGVRLDKVETANFCADEMYNTPNRKFPD